jgi:hypothetical protein
MRLPMTLAHDIMVAMHRGELSPAQAFAMQAAREQAPRPCPDLPDSAPRALALVTRAVIESPIGPALVAACASRGIRLELRECYHGYREAVGGAANLITWGMKQPHSWYIAAGRNVLFLENGLLSQRHGVYMDAGGYFADSSIVSSREWEREPTAAELQAVRQHLEREFVHPQRPSPYQPSAGFLLALQTPNDAPLQHYLSRGHGDGIQYVINAAACYLPEGVPVILRPHPRHEFDPAAYHIPAAWTLERGGNVYERLRTCRALVTANSTLGLEAMAMGLPVAFLGRHVYTGSGAALECDGCPERMAELLTWIPSPDRVQALLCAILRRQVAYRCTPADIEASPQFRQWTERCARRVSPSPFQASSGHAAAAMRIRCRRDPILWALADATEEQLGRCKPCSRGRHQNRLIEADRSANGGTPVLSPDLLERLAAAGLDVIRSDLSGYTDRLAEAQRACRERREPQDGDVTMGFLYGGHLGDALCSTALATSLRASGRTVRVVRHRNTIAAFAGHGIEHRNAGRIPLGPPANVGAGHLIQRMQRWFSVDEEAYPRPDIRLSSEEVAWAAEYCRSMPRPIILVSTGAISNADGYATMPWAEWGRILGGVGTVVQCLGADSDPIIPGASMAAGMSVRQWFSLFGQASAYVGTWAAGIHCAAAFGLETIVVTHPPVDPRRLVFPLPPAHIITFLYPQHAYGIPTEVSP